MNKKLNTLIILCLLVFSAGAQTVEKFIISVYEASEKENFDEAIALCDKAIAKYPQTPVFYVLKGEAYMGNRTALTHNPEQYTNAITWIDKAIELDGTFFYAYRSKGIVNLVHQKYEQAITEFNKFLKHTNNIESRFQTLTDRGTCYFHLGKFEEGEKDYEEAIKLNPGDWGIYSNLAMFFLDKKDYERVDMYLKKAENISPGNPYLYNNIGFVRLQQEKYKEALDFFEKAVQADKTFSYAYSNRGYCKFKEGKTKEGLADIEKAMSLDAQNAYAYKYRAIIHLSKKDKANACKDLEKANELGYSISYDSEVNDLIKENCK